MTAALATLAAISHLRGGRASVNRAVTGPVMHPVVSARMTMPAAEPLSLSSLAQMARVTKRALSPKAETVWATRGRRTL